MELALLASTPDTSHLVGGEPVSELHMVYGAVSALATAPLLTGVPASVAQGSTLVGARTAAVRLFVGRMSLVAVLAGVDTYRDELSRTPEGRAFLAVHDVAMVALAGRDIHKLATSGIGRELVNRGRLALKVAGARASSGLRESVESVQALMKTLERIVAEGKAVATPDGLRLSLAAPRPSSRHSSPSAGKWPLRGPWAAFAARGSRPRRPRRRWRR
ncbi:hypothetical protein ACN28S_67360 [Cystobacter fuscus]